MNRTPRASASTLLSPLVLWGVAALVYGLVLGVGLMLYQYNGWRGDDVYIIHQLAIPGVLLLANLVVLGLLSWVRADGPRRLVRRPPSSD